MKQFLKLTVLILITTLTACHKNSDKPSTPPPSGKTVQTAISTSLSGIDSFSNYATAFNNITLTDADVSQGITVFAPVNQGFATATTSIGNMPGRQVITTGDPVSRPVITGFTLPDTSDPKDYIVKGIITTSALTNGATFTALSGYPLTVTAVNGNLYLNGVLISGTNISSGANYLLYSISGLLKTSKILKITGLSDSTTFPGWLLTINGQNFDTTVANNIVKINGAQAMVHTATTNQLVVTVPPNATSGKVTVATKGTTLESKQSVRIMQAVVGTMPQSLTIGVSGVQGMAVDANDNLFITNNNYNQQLFNCIIKLSPDGYSEFMPLLTITNQDGANISAVANPLWALAVDNQNNVYYQSGTASTAPKNVGIFKFNTNNSNYAEWWAGNDALTGPYIGNKNNVPVNSLSLKFDAAGNLLVGDWAGLRKISPGGQVSLIADSLKFMIADPTVRKNPAMYGLDLDAAGNIYVSDGDQGNTRVWKISTKGTITSIAGNSNTGLIAKDGIGANAQFGDPFGLVLDKRGNIYVCDNDYTNSNFLIRMINPQGVVTTIAGRNNPDGSSTDGIGTNATFNGVNTIAIDSKGVLYVGPDEGGVRTITIQ